MTLVAKFTVLFCPFSCLPFFLSFSFLYSFIAFFHIPLELPSLESSTGLGPFVPSSLLPRYKTGRKTVLNSPTLCRARLRLPCSVAVSNSATEIHKYRPLPIGQDNNAAQQRERTTKGKRGQQSRLFVSPSPLADCLITCRHKNSAQPGSPVCHLQRLFFAPFDPLHTFSPFLFLSAFCTSLTFTRFARFTYATLPSSDRPHPAIQPSFCGSF